MISLDQIGVLEKRINSAVDKIESLTKENRELRLKCEELSAALHDKSLRILALENEGERVTDGLLKAMGRLNTIEGNVVEDDECSCNGTSLGGNEGGYSPASSISTDTQGTAKPADDNRFNIF